jgi:hypothetical protein
VSDYPYRAGALLEVMVVNKDGPSLTHGRSTVGDRRSARPRQTVCPRLSYLSKSFGPSVVLLLCNLFGLVPKVGRSVVTT